MLNQEQKNDILSLKSSNETNEKLFYAMRELIDETEFFSDDVIEEGGFRPSVKESVQLRSRVAKFMKELKRIGVGEFIIGRRGKRSRFILSSEVSCAEIIEAAEISGEFISS